LILTAYAQPKGAYCSLKSSILSLLACKGFALDCHPLGDHSFPKGNNQDIRACMLVLLFFLPGKNDNKQVLTR